MLSEDPQSCVWPRYNQRKVNSVATEKSHFNMAAWGIDGDEVKIPNGDCSLNVDLVITRQGIMNTKQYFCIISIP